LDVQENFDCDPSEWLTGSLLAEKASFCQLLNVYITHTMFY